MKKDYVCDVIDGLNAISSKSIEDKLEVIDTLCKNNAGEIKYKILDETTYCSFFIVLEIEFTIFYGIGTSFFRKRLMQRES